MNQPSGFGILRALLLIAGGVVFLILAFWVAVVVIGAALVFLLVRSVWRAITGKGRESAPAATTFLIQPAERSSYDNGNVIVLPITREASPRG